MFDSVSGSSVLAAGAVAEVTHALSTALQAPSGLDDPGRVEAVRALEELVCVATAAQAALGAELEESQRAELAHTWTAWRQGRITEWKAMLIARETACLTREDRASVDALLAGDAQRRERLEQMGDRELVMACQREAYQLDPESSLTRRRRAESDRAVTLRPAPDAMVWLTALVPVTDGVATYAALTRTADSARAAGDPRSKGQLMADTLLDAVLTAACSRDDATTRWHPAPTTEADHARRAGRGLEVGLVMTDAALFGTSDQPAHLDRYGPVPAELAREIITGACQRGEQTWLRRLYTHPTTGQLAAMDSRARLFRHSLARFIRLRDQTCRTPWCDAPIRHTDHPTTAAEGGQTTAVNGQGLCQACNHAKQAPGWTARAAPDPPGTHRVETTTTTGHTYPSTPPVILTLRETPIRLDLVLAG